MKVLKFKNALDLYDINKEIELHKDLDHPNIIKFIDSFESQNSIYIILEFAKNKDLFRYV